MLWAETFCKIVDLGSLLPIGRWHWKMSGRWAGGSHRTILRDLEKKMSWQVIWSPFFFSDVTSQVRTRFTAFVGVLLLWNVASSQTSSRLLSWYNTNKLEPDLNPAEDDGYSHFMTLKSEIGPHMKLMHMSCCFYHLTTSIMLEIRLRVEGWYHLLDQSMINQSEWRENLFI